MSEVIEEGIVEFSDEALEVIDRYVKLQKDMDEDVTKSYTSMRESADVFKSALYISVSLGVVFKLRDIFVGSPTIYQYYGVMALMPFFMFMTLWMLKGFLKYTGFRLLRPATNWFLHSKRLRGWVKVRKTVLFIIMIAIMTYILAFSYGIYVLFDLLISH